MQSEKLDVYLIQFSPEWGKIDASLKKMEEQIVEAFVSTSSRTESPHPEPVEGCPKLIVLPEMFSTGFKFLKEVAEPMNGKTVQWMQKTAQSLNTAIYGSVLILDNDRLYNRGFFVFPNGEYKCYDKRHCFVMSDEPKHITPGKEIVTVNYVGWRFRLNICHDLRFPVWSKNIYKNGEYDYDILLNTASWAEGRANVWRILLHARAIENLAYSIGVNRVGKDGDGYMYRGDSMVVDPKGIAVAMANPNEEQAVFVQLSKSALSEFREKFNVGAIWDSYEIKI
ncbi:MAG: nitrilase family protein [Bacteroidales bacterium]|nr:nitrilase family protein [Bacteroidales bacterium]